MNETISVILENISNSKNYEEIKIHLKSLITLIEKYKLTLGQDFSEKIENIKIKNIAELTVKLFDKLTEEDIFIINKNELVQIYSKTINNPNQVVIDQYTVFLIVSTHS
ncbi:hypothetical protein AS144_05590 [Francisella endosymbiont of Amblyomma maculatum]|nr:hypothetical protein AS144_05590 [Francisella endosymbiont of Amblyomma maculatum]